MAKSSNTNIFKSSDLTNFEPHGGLMGPSMGTYLLAIQQESLDRALSLYNFIPEVRSSGVRASITIVHV